MKITVNANITNEALKAVLKIQSEKIKIIDEFCKKEKIKGLVYKDAELEYEHLEKAKKENIKIQKIEVRTNDKRN